MNAVDTNILIYSIDADEPVKQPQAIALLNRLRIVSEPTILLWQVTGEFFCCLRRWQAGGKISSANVAGHLRDLVRSFPLVMPTPRVLETSLDLSARYSLSHWDSMLLAACLEAGVSTLYSEDLSHDAVYDSVTVVNPFA